MIRQAPLLCLAALLWAGPLAAQQPPSKTPAPTGSLTGTLIRKDTGEPIGRQWLTLKSNRWSRSTSTDTFGRFRFAKVPEGQNCQLSFYHAGYRVRQFGPFSVTPDKNLHVGTLEGVAVDAQVAPYTYSDTYLPGQNVGLMVRSIRATELDVAVYKVPTAELLSRKSALLDRKHLAIKPGWKRLLSYRQPIPGGHQLRWRNTRVEPAFNEPGTYIVRIAGAGTAKLIPIFVTRLALISKRTPDATWVWATDLETGKPLRGVRVMGETLDAKTPPPAGLLKPTTSRGDGLARFVGKHPRNIRYWGVVGDSLAYVDAVPATAAQSLAFRTYVYTDRPAYRPNDRVQFKVVARANQGGVYRVNPGEAWRVRVRDPDGMVVYSADKKTNLFGTFDGDFVLEEAITLGTWSVEARAGDKVSSGRFKVLEYRKPEYKLTVSTPKEQYVQGAGIDVGFQASYYFGAPLKGAKVMWTVYETPFRPWWYDSYYGAYDNSEVYGYGSVARSGTATLDERGQARITVSVDRASIDRWVTVEAVVTDGTNRQVSARKRVMVTRGTFRLGIRPEGRIFKQGESAAFRLESTRFDGTPDSREVTVTASLETFSKRHKIWIYKTLEKERVRTDANGKAVWRFPITRDGFIRVEVMAKDRFGNPIVESTFIWATAHATIAGGYKKKSLDILADKKRYQPGDTARILVNSTHANPWVLFSVEGDGIFEPRVVHFDGNSRLFEVKLTERHAPNVYVSVAFADHKTFNALSKSLAVSPAHRLLKVHIKSTQAEYEPGQTATYDVRVTDRKGKGVSAELSVGLVDAAIYAISAEMAPNIGTFYYGNRPNPVRTAHSFPSRYLGGADKDGEDGAGGQVRRDFKDTAFWRAQLRTDSTGHARVSVPLPDNLTTWRLTVRAVTQDTLVGQGTHEIRTSKKLVATLALPRFFRQGDEVEVVSMIHNRGEDLKAVTATLTAVDGAAQIVGEARQALGSMKGATSRAIRWRVKVPADGHVASFRVSVAGGGLTDAEERTVPVYPVAVNRLRGVSGVSKDSRTQHFELPTDVVDGTSGLSLRLAPSLASAMVDSLEELAAFPYGCVEQTMNSFLPDLIADRALRTLGVPRSGKLAKLPAMVRKGLRRLYVMQHDDGGWGWWSTDATHPFMTAYAVYGLSRAKRLGWNVRAAALSQGIRAAQKQFKASADANTRAFIVYALAHADRSPEGARFLTKALATVAKSQKHLNPYSLATLMLAYVEAGEAAKAVALAPTLRATAVVAGDLAHFPGRAWHYSWTDNAKEATAYAVRALLAVSPADPLIQSSVRWLMAKRRGGMWDTTKDTAAAVEAMVALAQGSGELSGHYTATFAVNGTQVGRFVVTPATVLSAAATLQVPRALLKKGDNVLQVTLDGQGSLYWTGQLTYGAGARPRKEGLGVTREYFKITRTPTKQGKETLTRERLLADNLNVGDEVEVKLTVYPDRPAEYLAVEDPLPAGFEVIPVVGSAGFTQREVRDQKVAFFLTRPTGRKLTLTYRLRAEMAGYTTAAPAVAWLMYMPEIMGNSSVERLRTHATD